MPLLYKATLIRIRRAYHTRQDDQHPGVDSVGRLDSAPSRTTGRLVEEQRMSDWLGWWFGWVWRRGRWQRVCVSGTMAEAARALSIIGDRLKVPDACVCMTRGAAPDWVPPTRSRTPH
jgi:hypothetical protein